MLKKLFFLITALVVIVLAAAAVAPLFINAENLKAPILKQLEAATKYHIAIGGELKFSLLPTASVRVQKVAISSPQAGAKPFAQVQEIEVGVHLLPLLHGDVQLTNLTLKKPEFTLKHSAAGDNWQPGQTAASTQPAAAPKAQSSASVPLGVLVGNVNINDGLLSYEDTQQNQKFVLSAFNLKAGVASLASSYKLAGDAAWNGKPVSLTLEVAHPAALLDNGASDVEGKFTSELLTASAKGKADRKQFTGDIALASASLSKALQWLGAGTQKPSDPLPLAAFALKGKAVCSVAACALSNADVTLDDMQLTGDVKVTQGVKTGITANLSTKLLNITPYLAKQTASLSLISDAMAAEERWSRTPIDLAFLDQVNADITLAAERFVARQFVLGDLSLHAKIGDGSLWAEAQRVKLYDGTANITTNLDADGRSDLKIAANGVDLLPMLKAFAGSDRLSGKASFAMKLATQGKSAWEMVSHLDGSGDVQVADGTLHGVDILGMLRNAKASFLGGSQGSAGTPFSQLGGSFTIANGILNNNDLTAKTAQFEVAGKGMVNLPAYTIDYRLMPKLSKAGDLSVPVRISGSLDRPSYAPDLSGVIDDALNNPQKLKEQLKGAKQLLKGDGTKEGKPMNQLKGLLKGL